MAFHNSYTFSHRLTASDAPAAPRGTWSEINHQTNAESSDELVSNFFQFLLGCGFAPQSVVNSMILTAEEYGTAFCKEEGVLVWKKREEFSGSSSTGQ